MTAEPTSRYVGRGANLAPPNRFESVRHEAEFEQLATDDELLAVEECCRERDRDRSVTRRRVDREAGFVGDVGAQEHAATEGPPCAQRGAHASSSAMGAGGSAAASARGKSASPLTMRVPGLSDPHCASDA